MLISEINKPIVEEIDEKEAIKIHSYPNEQGIELNDNNAVNITNENQINKVINDVVNEKKSNKNLSVVQYIDNSKALVKKDDFTINRYRKKIPQPDWHAPWKLMRVITGHLGWVRSIAIDHTNEWFATGSADRTIKIWDLASGKCKITLTGHIHTIRGLAISDKHPYLFSCGEDKAVKCWDLEQNKAIRSYHGHLNGVYSITLHPTLDIVITGGRDACARVWDMRSKNEIFVLGGHTDTVFSVIAQAGEPQIITGSADCTIRLWDLRTGKRLQTLTHHKKGIRSMAFHPTEYTWISGASDNLKKWLCPNGEFMMNFSGHNSVINSVAVNSNNVLTSCADDGSLSFWDWNSGYCFQKSKTIPQPGSMASEAGIYASTFDQTGSRFFTCEADKTIKVWKEDENSTPENYPIDMKSWEEFCRRPRR